MKVSVVTSTMRPWDFLLEQAKGLQSQTLKDFEWVVIDDLHAQRPDFLKGNYGFPITHVPPRVLKDCFAAASAWNTGFIHARGDLVYFMNDYIGLPPRVLERHWELYQAYGPDVIISGQIEGMAGSREIEHRRPLHGLGEDVGEIRKNDVEYIRRWYWAGRNDSASLARCLEVNGFDERCDGAYGGQDCELAMRLVNVGCRYLIDTLSDARVFEYRHDRTTKREPGQGVLWLDLFATASGGRVLSGNDWSIRAEREKAGMCAV